MRHQAICFSQNISHLGSDLELQTKGQKSQTSSDQRKTETKASFNFQKQQHLGFTKLKKVINSKRPTPPIIELSIICSLMKKSKYNTLI